MSLAIPDSLKPWVNYFYEQGKIIFNRFLITKLSIFQLIQKTYTFFIIDLIFQSYNFPYILIL